MDNMAHTMSYISDLVLKQLAQREMRVLSLVVAVRNMDATSRSIAKSYACLR